MDLRHAYDISIQNASEFTATLQQKIGDDGEYCKPSPSKRKCNVPIIDVLFNLFTAYRMVPPSDVNVGF